MPSAGGVDPEIRVIVIAPVEPPTATAQSLANTVLPTARAIENALVHVVAPKVTPSKRTDAVLIVVGEPNELATVWRKTPGETETETNALHESEAVEPGREF